MSNDKLWVIVVPDSWVLMLAEIFGLYLCSLYEPWREPGASNQLVRDDSCSRSSRSALLKQTDCSKTQNKPYHGPSPKALHVHSPACPHIFTCHHPCCTLHRTTTEHTRKRQHTFSIRPQQSWPPFCSCPACTCGFLAHDGRSPALGWPQPWGAQLTWDRLGWGVPPDRVQLWLLDFHSDSTCFYLSPAQPYLLNNLNCNPWQSLLCVGKVWGYRHRYLIVGTNHMDWQPGCKV